MGLCSPTYNVREHHIVWFIGHSTIPTESCRPRPHSWLDGVTWRDVAWAAVGDVQTENRAKRSNWRLVSVWICASFWWFKLLNNKNFCWTKCYIEMSDSRHLKMDVLSIRQKKSQIECQKECQIECHIDCQKECQIICQIECQNIFKICPNIRPDMSWHVMVGITLKVIFL